MRKKKMIKQVVTGIITAVMVVSGVVVLPKTTFAAETTEMNKGDVVCYEEMTAAKFGELYGDEKKVAPTKEGYLFGGWYLDSTLKNPVKAKSDVTENVYAKFVPAYVLSVKAQNYAATTASTNGMASAENKTTTRVVSSVDASLLYKEVGFEVIINGKEPVTVNTTKVWDTLAVGTGDARKEYEATKIFGNTSKYFFLLNINNIPETKWGDAVYVRPYWITEDGTTVEGLGKYVYVEDGVKGYISVPVNLNNVKVAVAAGVLDVDYDETRFEFMECVTGRIFEEMEVADREVNGNKYVRCAGNVEELIGVAKDDMYITLRFKVITSETIENRTASYKFIVSNEDFVNLEEKETTLNVWDVQY